MSFRAIAHEEWKVEEARGRGWRCFNGFDVQGDVDDWWGLPKREPPEWITAMHNVAKGKRVFLMGTGPSLTSQTELLKRFVDEEVFTVNRMKQWTDLPFTPMCHVISEPGPVLSWGRIVRHQYDFPKAQNRVAINWWPVTAPGWLWCPKAPDDVQVRWEGTWGMGDTFYPVPTAWASPLTAAQLALWMGYTEIYVLGVDSTQVGQVWDVEQGRTAEERNIRSIMECAERMWRDIKRNGRELWDCTPGGRLNEEGCIPYRDLAEVLG